MGWLTPDEIPETDKCRSLFIPDNSDWLAIVSGAILELTRKWNWEQFGALTPEECAERMQTMFDSYYIEDCNDCLLPDGERVIRLSFDGYFEELRDGAWVPPEGDYALPPVPTREGGTAEDRRCLAAANAANVLSLLYEEVTDMFTGEVTEAEALLAFGVAIGLAIIPPLGLLAASVLAIGLLAFGEFFAFMDFLTEDVWTSDFNQALTCMLYGCSSDDEGVVTFDMDCLLEALHASTNPFELSFTEIRLFAQVSYMLSIIGTDGLNQAGATTAIEEADCNICGYWCVTWDLEETDAGIVGSCATFPTATCDATWVDGEGWKGYSGGVAAGVEKFMISKFTFEECYIRSAVIVCQAVGLSGANYCNTRLTAHSATDPLTHVQDQTAGSSEPIGNELSIEDNCSELWIGAGVAAAGGGDTATGYVLHKVLTIYGSGAIPEGWIPNCDPVP